VLTFGLFELSEPGPQAVLEKTKAAANKIVNISLITFP
jgi:hypothetical protein